MKQFVLVGIAATLLLTVAAVYRLREQRLQRCRGELERILSGATGMGGTSDGSIIWFETRRGWVEYTAQDGVCWEFLKRTHLALSGLPKGI